MDDALPVVVDLADDGLAADVAAHVEGVLGWQVIRPGPHLPARLCLADRADQAIPTVVIIAADSPGPADGHGALAVLRWPDDAARLTALVPPRLRPGPPSRLLVVTGASAGVGTSTVALALGAHHAWTDGAAVVVTDPAGLAMAGGGATVPGVAGLSVRARGGVQTLSSSVVVVDRGVGGRAQVLVARPDRALLDALRRWQDPRTTVLTVGEGGLRPREVERALEGRAHLRLEWSFRVARAGVRGRVPGALPGAYLSAIAGVARSVDRHAEVAR